jgi:hypothetical protein
MNCQTCERWVSDELDGRFPPRRKAALERHLRKCASCRAYRGELVRLQKEAPKLYETDRGPAYWESFIRRLGLKLASEEPSSEAVRGGSAFRRWRWAWAGAAFLVLAVAGLLFLSGRKPLLPDRLALSHEESLVMILGELDTDPGLARAFSEHIEASLKETAGLNTQESPPRFRDDPFFWESLTEEELASLVQELRIQYGQTEVSHEVF